MAGEKGHWKCPVCNKASALESLEIDQFTWSIIQTPRFTEVDEVSLDQNANVSALKMPSMLKVSFAYHA